MKKSLKEVLESKADGQQVVVSPALPLPTRPFTETHRGKQLESARWAIQTVAERVLHKVPLGLGVASRLKVIKGMPMLGLVLSHDFAPPDEGIPYQAAVLSPLTCFNLCGFGYECSPDGNRLSAGHQVFKVWQDPEGGWVSRMCQWATR